MILETSAEFTTPKEPVASTEVVQGSNLPLRILILDDSRFDRARMRRMVGQAGLFAEITEADSIATMQEALTKKTFDLFIIDYRLPAESGFGALRRLRQTEQFGRAGVIMVTGIDEPEMASAALHSGCDLFLQKDELSPRRLHDAVDETMARRERRLAQTEAHERGIVCPDPARSVSSVERADMRRGVETRVELPEVKTAEHSRDAQRMVNLAINLMQQDDFMFH